MCNMWYSDYMQRVVVYVPQDAHKRLKVDLMTKGLTVSEWFREMAEKELMVEPEKISRKKINDTVVEKVMEHRTCAWNKAFKCKSPATVKVKSKWYCAPHAIS